MFRHGVVHEGVVLVTDDPSSIGDLGDVPRSITLVGTAAVPDLIVKHTYTAGFTQVVLDFIFPFSAFDLTRRPSSEEMGSGNGFRSSMFNFCNIG